MILPSDGRPFCGAATTRTAANRRLALRSQRHEFCRSVGMVMGVKGLVTLGAFMALVVACAGQSVARLDPRTLSRPAEAACRSSAAALCARAVDCSPKLVDFFFGSRELCENDTAPSDCTGHGACVNGHCRVGCFP